MSKHRAVLIVFLCFAFQLTISCATTGGGNKGPLTDSDIETVSWSFQSGYSYGNFSLFSLNAAAAKRNPQLNDYINALLYRGRTAQGFLDYIKADSAEWDREGYEIKYTWEIKGKYLLLKGIYSGAVGSSYNDSVFFIIDTALIKRLTINDIIVDSGSPDLQRLVWDRLSRAGNFSWIASRQTNIYKSLEERSFSIFIDGSNFIFHWNEGLIAANAAGAFEAALQRSEVLPYLTDTGRELLN
jgi:hypothetical protein